MQTRKKLYAPPPPRVVGQKKESLPVLAFNLKIQQYPSNSMCDDYVYIHVHASMNACCVDRDG